MNKNLSLVHLGNSLVKSIVDGGFEIHKSKRTQRAKRALGLKKQRPKRGFNKIPPETPSKPKISRQGNTRITITYKDNSVETYKEASIGRIQNNTLWVLFFGKVICLTNVRAYSIQEL